MAVRRILAGALSAPLLLLAGCGGGGGSIADPPLSSAPSSSPTAQARETPEHFIRRWFSVGTRMQNTGNPATYLSMQHDCRGCKAVARKVTSAYGAGGYYRTKGIRDLKVLSSQETAAGHVLKFRLNSYPTDFKTSADAANQHFHGGTAEFQVTLAKAKSSWLVTEFVQLAS